MMRIVLTETSPIRAMKMIIGKTTKAKKFSGSPRNPVKNSCIVHVKLISRASYKFDGCQISMEKMINNGILSDTTSNNNEDDIIYARSNSNLPGLVQ